MDWISYIFLILQMLILSYRPKQLSEYFNLDKLAFLCGLVGSICLILFGVQIRSTSMILFNCVICFLNFRGYNK